MAQPSHAFRTPGPRAPILLLPVALLAMAGGASEAAASQSSSPSIPSTPSISAPETSSAMDVERAQALEVAARGLQDQLHRRGRAARLYREAAELRPADDPVRVENLRHAARMNFYAGHLDRAIRDSRDASESALRQGKVVEAAHAAMDAAWLAGQIGQADRALNWLEEARMLAGSPHLDASEREGLHRRLREVT